MVISAQELGIVRRSLGSLAPVWCMVYLEEQEERTTCASGPVLHNAVIGSAYLPFCFKDWDSTQFHLPPLDVGSYPLMFLFGFITTGLGEAVVLYVLGASLARAQHWPLPQQLGF